MNHLSMDALLALREPGTEPGTATAREHLNHCPHCQLELDRLHQRVARLKALPSLRPRKAHADGWNDRAGGGCIPGDRNGHRQGRAHPADERS